MRRVARTLKVRTDFGAMYIHVDLDPAGHPTGGSISTPGKEPESQISKLIGEISAGLNNLLAEIGKEMDDIDTPSPPV